MSKVSLGFFAVALAAGATFGFSGAALTAPAAKSPKAVAVDPELKCGNLSTMQERVRCRLELSPDELEREDAAQYLPEECRATDVASAQAACVTRHRSLQPCLAKPVGDERVACAQTTLGLDRSVDELVRQCRGQRACLLGVQEKVYDLTKFRLSDLQQRARELLAAKAVDVSLASTFISAVEEQKLAFNLATDNRERQQILYAVRKTWQELVEAARRAER